MTCVAYSYSDPLLESPPDTSAWGWPIAWVYQDLGDRQALNQLLEDCRTGTSQFPESTPVTSTPDAPPHAPNTPTPSRPNIPPHPRSSAPNAPTHQRTNVLPPDAKPIDTVILRRLDELGDTVDEVGDRLNAFESLGIRLITLNDDMELTDPDLTQADLLKQVQAMQQRQQAQRIRQGHARNRVKALPPPGKAPYGYRRGRDRYVVDRSTSPVVKDFFDHFLLYGSLRGSVRYLEKKYNKKISVATGRRWLTSPVYRGNLAYQNGEVVPDTHPPILAKEEAAQVDRILRRNRQLPPRSASAPRSLAGLVFCAACQSPMTIIRTTYRRKQREYLYLSPVACPYRKGTGASKNPLEKNSEGIAAEISEGKSADASGPEGCRGICQTVPYQEVLERTIQQICSDLPKAVAGVELPDVEAIKQQLRNQIAVKQAILEQLPQLRDSGVLDAETADLRAYKVRVEMAELQSRLDQLPPVNLKATVQVVSIPQFWLDLSEAERRFYFREFIRQIQLYRPEAEADGEFGVKLMFIF